jgi:hypothetical protein
MLWIASSPNPFEVWTTLGGTGALIALFWIVVRALRQDNKDKDATIVKKDEHIAELNKQYREDGLRNLEVLKDVTDLVNSLASSQTGTQREIRDGFSKLTTHITEAVTKIEQKLGAG